MSNDGETDRGRASIPEPAKSFIEQRQNARIGPIAGAGPNGAQLLSYNDLPDNTEALKHMYLELQRTLQDMEARHHKEKERLQWGGEDTLEDLLSRFWWRGWELIFIISILSFVVPIITVNIFSETQQIIGIIILTAFWERYLREPVHSIGQAIDDNYIP